MCNCTSVFDCIYRIRIDTDSPMLFSKSILFVFCLHSFPLKAAFYLVQVGSTGSNCKRFGLLSATITNYTLSPTVAYFSAAVGICMCRHFSWQQQKCVHTFRQQLHIKRMVTCCVEMYCKWDWILNPPFLSLYLCSINLYKSTKIASKSDRLIIMASPQTLRHGADQQELKQALQAAKSPQPFRALRKWNRNRIEARLKYLYNS